VPGSGKVSDSTQKPLPTVPRLGGTITKILTAGSSSIPFGTPSSQRSKNRT
jgi:hypothetical protein